jgi:hypothetical protein
MALVTPSPRSPAPAIRQGAHGATAVPLAERPEPVVARVAEEARRESVRMDLLLARAARR